VGLNRRRTQPYNVFDFTLGRGRDGPVKFLGSYKQIRLADAYGGYDGVVMGNDITRAGTTSIPSVT
jgi:hypothetical protein